MASHVPCAVFHEELVGGGWAERGSAAPLSTLSASASHLGRVGRLTWGRSIGRDATRGARFE
jgi:hypothetical protein